MKITFGIVLLATTFFHGTYQQCLTTNDNSRNPAVNARKILYSGQQTYSLNLLQAINRLQPKENIFFSPYSTFHALAIAYFLAGGQTEGYLKKLLRLDDFQTKADIYNAYKLDKLMTDSDAKHSQYEFTNANKIYVAEQIKVRDCLFPLFNYELQQFPFKTDPNGARNRINQWVEDQTHNMIKDLLPPGTIDTSTTLVLANAAYFKGMWDQKFDPNQTKSEIFYVSGSKQIMVPMMHVEGSFNHDVSETLGAHILELPYQGDNVSMYILLPPFSKEGAIDETLKKLSPEEFSNIVNNHRLVSKNVQVSLPKFSLEHTIELVPILESLGVGNLFKSDADFSTLTNENITLGEGIHKAKVVVNEKGTQAAAATVLLTWRMMDEDEDEAVEFKCDKPFIFLIYNKRTSTILFSGILKNPTLP